jgi:hypothetical protein
VLTAETEIDRDLGKFRFASRTAALNIKFPEAGIRGGRSSISGGWRLTAGLVGSMIVVMAPVGVQQLPCVSLIEDEHVVTDLVGQGLNGPIAVCVGDRGGQSWRIRQLTPGSSSNRAFASVVSTERSVASAVAATISSAAPRGKLDRRVEESSLNRSACLVGVAFDAVEVFRQHNRR